MKKVFVTRQIPKNGIKLLKDKGYDVKVNPHDRILTKTEIIKHAKGCDALLCLLTDKIDGRIMDAIGSQLKVIANYAVGYDNIDLKAAKERKIVVTNTPGSSSLSVAEHTFALMLSLAKRIAEADQFTRDGNYKGWAPLAFLGSNMHDKSVGIVGLGRIGSTLAEIASKGFKMDVYYFDIKRSKKFERKFKAKYMSMNELLQKSDFVSLHVPLLPSTRHLIGRSELKKMKKTAFLINTSRGPVIDEKALATALKNGDIKGAGLDVYEFEPKITKALTTMDNVIMTPHTASSSVETRSQMSEAAAMGIISAFSRRKTKNRVV